MNPFKLLMFYLRHRGEKHGRHFYKRLYHEVQGVPYSRINGSYIPKRIYK